MSEVIFEITEDLLDSGLRGFPVGYCTSSDVDPIKGLLMLKFPLRTSQKKILLR